MKQDTVFDDSIGFFESIDAKNPSNDAETFIKNKDCIGYEKTKTESICTELNLEETQGKSLFNVS